MKIAHILFNGITWLDFFGFYEPISKLKSLKYLPDLTWEVCSFTEMVSDNFGLTVKPDRVQNSLAEYDAIIIPGGFGTRPLQFDKEFINWIRAGETAKYKISVCTGSLILGAAGFLEDRKATTNYQEYETLEPYCKQVIKQRIVDDNNVITAGAVSASIDLGLYLCEKWVGPEAKYEIRKIMDYNG